MALHYRNEVFPPCNYCNDGRTTQNYIHLEDEDMVDVAASLARAPQ
jgi:hypothetical protein